MSLVFVVSRHAGYLVHEKRLSARACPEALYDSMCFMKGEAQRTPFGNAKGMIIMMQNFSRQAADDAA